MTALLSVEKLSKNYASRHGPVRAVDDVSFSVAAGETLALVGESGCGKSTIALSLVRLIEPDGGEIKFDNIAVAPGDRSAIHIMRQDLGIVFQNPYSSLNPKMKVRDIVGEPLRTVLGLRGSELNERVEGHLRQVGLGQEHMNRYPHEFSGGQRQRIAISRAIALKPRLLILDEPTAALDVSIQAQVLNLLIDLQEQLGLAYIFISHNLATVDYIAQRVMVMYLGRIVEAGPVDDVFAAPRHPYTRALIDSIPNLNPRRRKQLLPLAGDVPSPVNLPPGCAFEPRCANRTGLCAAVRPELMPAANHRSLACFNPLDEDTVP